MKQCKVCGANVPDEARFCQTCGNSEFYMNNPQLANVNPVNTSQPAYGQNQYNQQSMPNQQWQQPMPQNQPKKKNVGLIIGVVAAVLIVLAGIDAAAEKLFQEQGYGVYDDAGDDFNASNDVISNSKAYTEGTFDGAVYTNEWADIQFALPEGFSDADAATYSAAENANTDCGLYFIADDTMGLIYVCFEKLPAFPTYDEESYMDVLMDSLSSLTQLTYTVPDTYTTATVGGYAYTKAECELNNGYGDFSNTIYVRKLDDYMIVISTVGISPEANATLVKGITGVD